MMYFFQSGFLCFGYAYQFLAKECHLVHRQRMCVIQGINFNTMTCDCCGREHCLGLLYRSANNSAKLKKARQVEMIFRLCFAKKYEIIKNMAHAGHLRLMLDNLLQGL